MLQPKSQASWPIGMSGIRLHPTALDPEEVVEEAKGWLLFVQEESQPTSTPEDGLRHRRSLIEKWATASQEFREVRTTPDFDGLLYSLSLLSSAWEWIKTLKHKPAAQSYHNRAAGYASALDYPAMTQQTLLVSAPRGPADPSRNYIHLVKFLILLYVHQDEWSGPHPFDLHGAGDASRCHIPELLDPGSPAAAPTMLSEILPALYLAPADFHALSMTRDGTVVFAGGPGLTWFVIDAPDWPRGASRWPSLAPTATSACPPSVDLGTWAKPCLRADTGLDMDLPILELLKSTRRANRFLYTGYGSRDLWVRIIEQSAPGYLELEAQGREVEYELDNLLVINP
ncbi:hypothetical protein BDV30DRAFT_238018 [Aspergillus minisclerotigenes]|uniref:Uncharacterized protein n=1 Tax=Aspergillus minisclerotigenes TaxID=656917 RepID=A0A5N6J6X4_9EURO|nr:hypothetical protein BDV30DRAFT_238018 [Aspergillus minisclerotigenes]